MWNIIVECEVVSSYIYIESDMTKQLRRLYGNSPAEICLRSISTRVYDSTRDLCFIYALAPPLCNNNELGRNTRSCSYSRHYADINHSVPELNMRQFLLKSDSKIHIFIIITSS